MKIRSMLAVVAALLFVVLAVGCRPPTTQPIAPSEPTPTAGTTETTNPTEPTEPTEEVLARLYFVRNEKIGVAGREILAPAKPSSRAFFALEALVEGPTAEDSEYGLETAIPKGTKVIGLEIENGVATVNLSNDFQSGGGSLSMQLRVAQVVCTLTQFPEVKRVAFELDGKPAKTIGGEGIVVDPPVDRADFENVLPPVLVETPAPGQTVSSPVTISGSSNVFEATHQIEVTDPDGLIIAKKTVTATSGTGTRGTWKESVSFGPLKRSGLGAIIVFEYSAEDGSRINIVEIPVRMEK